VAVVRVRLELLAIVAVLAEQAQQILILAHL
jgi:hypothetical protein